MDNAGEKRTKTTRQHYRNWSPSYKSVIMEEIWRLVKSIRPLGDEEDTLTLWNVCYSQCARSRAGLREGQRGKLLRAARSKRGPVMTTICF